MCCYIAVIAVIFYPQNIGLEICYVQLSLLLTELWRNIDFSLMAALFCTLSCVRHIMITSKIVLYHQSIGFDTSYVEISALWAEICRKIHFPVMAALICIKMVCGTF